MHNLKKQHLYFRIQSKSVTFPEFPTWKQILPHNFCALVPPLNHLVQDIIENDIWLHSSFQKPCLAVSIFLFLHKRNRTKYAVW